MISVKAQGSEKLIKNYGKLITRLNSQGKRVIKDEAQKLAFYMQAAAPFKSRKLKEGIEARKHKDQYGVVGYVVGITKESVAKHPEYKGIIKHPRGKRKDYFYPASQEYGWTTPKGHEPGQPYIRPSFEKRKETIFNILKSIWKTEVDKGGV